MDMPGSSVVLCPDPFRQGIHLHADVYHEVAIGTALSDKAVKYVLAAHWIVLHSSVVPLQGFRIHPAPVP